LLWSYDTEDVIRSSPIVNQSPEGTDVVYFGAGDGILYAIDEDGAVRWEFDTGLMQIGFDSYYWLVSVVSKSAADSQGEGQLLAFVLGARQLADGIVEPRAVPVRAFDV
jgi:outer membrane protein assembly factor BamB